ncbi:hypothetical protein LTR66_016743 [Elasticomyces elasticus]|nr:hypothetical protein LTR66_016743 [Elasticomyces elasticus]
MPDLAPFRDDNESPFTDAILHDTLPFPPVTAQHILNCSVHSWYPGLSKGRTPRTRLIPLTQPFINYLKAAGIILPPDTPTNQNDSGYSDGEDDEDDDPSVAWAGVHSQIQDTMRELDGTVLPKLNWSAPKDATWILPSNDMKCKSANDIYLLLKSSDFVTHDLEQAFDGCVDSAEIPYHLVLRKYFNLNPSTEFRCFVRNRRVIGISQREMNHFEHLVPLRDEYRDLILESVLDFPDPDFVFDVYIAPPKSGVRKVWIIDINPWAPRTDPLLFSWLELLTMDEPEDEEEFVPEIRLVQRDDPEAYQFASTKYSAHKLPKDVVDASMVPGDAHEMLEQWRNLMSRQNEEDERTERQESDADD